MKKLLIPVGVFLGIGCAIIVGVASSMGNSRPDQITVVDANTPDDKLAEAAVKKQGKDPKADEKPPRTTDELVRDCLPSVAIIKGKVGHGTGFMLPHNVVATNAHVVSLEFEENLRVYFPSAPKGNQGPYPAKVIWADKRRDLAFLEVECDIDALELAEQYTLKPGQEIIAIGSPGLGGNELLPNSPTKGLMSNMHKLGGLPCYALSLHVNPGNSGGPVLDLNGRVLGMVTAKARDKDGIAFAIPLEDLYNGYHQEVLAQGREAGVEMTSWLRACTVFERLIYLGSEYSLGLDTYSRAMDAAHARGGSPNDGLKAVSKEMAPRVKQTALVFGDDLPKKVREVTADGHIHPADRERIAQLWNVCKEMKDWFDSPRGTIDSYRARKESLKKQFANLITFAKNPPKKPGKKAKEKDPDDE